ncbi:MAG: hypothetical protein AAF696_19360, partial [Bacteroidota bacterium]
MSFLPAVLAELPSNYADYDVQFYDLEIKLDAKYERIAGTSHISFTPKKKLAYIEIDLDPFMEVAYVIHRNKRLRFDHRNGRLRLSFGRSLKAGSPQEVSVVFYGAPGLSESVYYTGGIIWEKDPIGKDLILTRKGSRGTGCWWPHKYDPRDPADSMRFSVIYPREMHVVVPGRLRNVEILPGEFKKWTFDFRHEMRCGSLQFGIGNLLRAQSSYQSNRKEHKLVAYTVAGQYNLALDRLKKVQGIMSFMENYFGEYPFWEDGFHLFEPAFLSEKGQMGFEEKRDIKGTEAWLYEVVVSDWLGRSLIHAEDADLWLLNMLKRYSESLYVGYLDGESAGIKFLESQKDKSEYKRAWMLHGLRRTLDDEQKWWEMLRSLYTNYRHDFIDSDDWYQHLFASLGEENQYYWTQYFQENQVPVLELLTKRKGKRMNISYRW